VVPEKLAQEIARMNRRARRLAIFSLIISTGALCFSSGVLLYKLGVL
jgi:hypothetical protein